MRRVNLPTKFRRKMECDSHVLYNREDSTNDGHSTNAAPSLPPERAPPATGGGDVPLPPEFHPPPAAPILPPPSARPRQIIKPDQNPTGDRQTLQVCAQDLGVAGGVRPGLEDQGGGVWSLPFAERERPRALLPKGNARMHNLRQRERANEKPTTIRPTPPAPELLRDWRSSGAGGVARLAVGLSLARRRLCKLRGW